MPVPSILRNDKRFRKEVLDEASGEQLIFGGCADGIVKVYSRYTQMSTEDKKKVKSRRMTLFPTNRRIVAYEAGGFLTNDRYAQIPLDSLSKIVFQAWADKGRVQLVTDFVAPDDSEYRSISFMMPVPDLKQFEAFRAIIAGVSKTARVQIEDLTDYKPLQGMLDVVPVVKQKPMNKMQFPENGKGTKAKTAY